MSSWTRFAARFLDSEIVLRHATSWYPMEFVGDVVIVWPAEDAAAHSVELLGMDEVFVIGFEEQSGGTLAEFHAAASKIPCFDTLAVESDACLMLWITELSGMRPRIASHCVFRRIWASKTRCHDYTSKIPCFDMLAVESDACLVLGHPS